MWLTTRSRSLMAVVFVLGALSFGGGSAFASGATTRQDAPPATAAAVPSTTLPGDVNGDCQVNVLDLALVGSRFLVSFGSLLYSRAYDLNGNGTIDIFDLQIIASRFGQHC